MNLERVLTICPYLIGSTDGVICKAADILVRDIQDIHPEICISRHFEMCHLYIAQLQTIEDRYPALSPQITNTV